MKKVNVVSSMIMLVGGGFILGAVVADRSMQMRFQEENIRLKTEVAIYKAEADKYAKTIQSIREAAAQSTVAEKAQ